MMLKLNGFDFFITEKIIIDKVNILNPQMSFENTFFPEFSATDEELKKSIKDRTHELDNIIIAYSENLKNAEEYPEAIRAKLFEVYKNLYVYLSNYQDLTDKEDFEKYYIKKYNFKVSDCKLGIDYIFTVESYTESAIGRLNVVRNFQF